LGSREKKKEIIIMKKAEDTGGRKNYLRW